MVVIQSFLELAGVHQAVTQLYVQPRVILSLQGLPQTETVQTGSTIKLFSSLNFILQIRYEAFTCKNSPEI